MCLLFFVLLSCSDSNFKSRNKDDKKILVSDTISFSNVNLKLYDVNIQDSLFLFYDKKAKLFLSGNIHGELSEIISLINFEIPIGSICSAGFLKDRNIVIITDRAVLIVSINGRVISLNEDRTNFCNSLYSAVYDFGYNKDDGFLISQTKPFHNPTKRTYKKVDKDFYKDALLYTKYNFEPYETKLVVGFEEGSIFLNEYPESCIFPFPDIWHVGLAIDSFFIQINNPEQRFWIYNAENGLALTNKSDFILKYWQRLEPIELCKLNPIANQLINSRLLSASSYGNKIVVCYDDGLMKKIDDYNISMSLNPQQTTEYFKKMQSFCKQFELKNYSSPSIVEKGSGEYELPQIVGPVLPKMFDNKTLIATPNVSIYEDPLNTIVFLLQLPD